MNGETHREMAAAVAARYRHHWQRSYIRGKLRWDPLFTTLAPVLAESPRALLDIGCGIGLLGQMLRELGFRGGYRGLDVDTRKIDDARQAAQGANPALDFAVGSADSLPEFEGDVALFDVLHYMPAGMQRNVLIEAASRVEVGGVLLIRNVLRENTWRFRVTVAQEQLARLLGWMRTPLSHFPVREEIESPLRDMGFEVCTEPLWGGTPFNSYLVTARRVALRT